MLVPVSRLVFSFGKVNLLAPLEVSVCMRAAPIAQRSPNPKSVQQRVGYGTREKGGKKKKKKTQSFSGKSPLVDLDIRIYGMMIILLYIITGAFLTQLPAQREFIPNRSREQASMICE